MKQIEPLLIGEKSLGNFFYQEIKSAQKDIHIAVSDHAEYYLVNLLCEYGHPAQMESEMSEPLTILLSKAEALPWFEKAQNLKYIGDFSLYTAGYFAQKVAQGLVDSNYYIRIGARAYHRLSSCVHGDVSLLYRAMAVEFSKCRKILEEISQRAQDRSDAHKDVGHLYERFLRSKSERLKRILLSRGMLIDESESSQYVLRS